MRIAVIGDIHGCIEELQELVQLLQAEGIDQIFHLGDLIDRGPDSGAVVDYIRTQGIKGVMGNHESKLLEIRRRMSTSVIASLDKRRSAEQLDARTGAWEFLSELPRLHVIDDLLPEPIVLVHGGLWPKLALYQQPFAILMAQLIDPHKPGSVAWLSDQSALARGLRPWWEVWDGREYVLHGHTVFDELHHYGKTFGLDTGCVFGGSLTALILPEFRKMEVKAKAIYADRKGRNHEDS